MWSGVLHDRDFVGQVLEHLERNENIYGTLLRMKGMLTVAKEASNVDNPFIHIGSWLA